MFLFSRSWIEHGETPFNSMYSYVILPVADVYQTESFAMSPAVKILSQTSTLHVACDLISKVSI